MFGAFFIPDNYCTIFEDFRDSYYQGIHGESERERDLATLKYFCHALGTNRTTGSNWLIAEGGAPSGATEASKTFELSSFHKFRKFANILRGRYTNLPGTGATVAVVVDGDTRTRTCAFSRVHVG